MNRCMQAMAMLAWVCGVGGVTRTATLTQTISVSVPTNTLTETVSLPTGTVSVTMPTSTFTETVSLTESVSIPTGTTSETVSASLPTGTVSVTMPTGTFTETVSLTESVSIPTGTTSETVSVSLPTGTVSVTMPTSTFTETVSLTESVSIPTGTTSETVSASLPTGTVSATMPTGTFTETMSIPTGTGSETVSVTLPTGTVSATLPTDTVTGTMSQTETSSFSESVSVSIPSGTVTGTESVTLPTGTVSETVTLPTGTETFTETVSLPTATESTSYTMPTATGSVTRTSTMTETASMTETVTLSLPTASGTATVSYTQPTSTASKSVTMSLSLSATFSLSFTDSASLSMTLPTMTSSDTMSLTLTDTFSLTSSFSLTQTFSLTATASFSESATFSQTLTDSQSLSATYSESLSTTDSVTQSLTQTFTESLTDTFSLSQTFSLSLTFSMSLTSTYSLSQTFSQTATFSATATDSFSLTESASLTASASLVGDPPDGSMVVNLKGGVLIRSGWVARDGAYGSSDDAPCDTMEQSLDLGPGQSVVQVNTSLPRGSLSVGVWARSVTNSSNGGNVVSIDTQKLGGPACFGLAVFKSIVMIVDCDGGPVAESSTAVPEVPLGWWVHWGVVFSNAKLRVYINGWSVLNHTWSDVHSYEGASEVLLGKVGNATNTGVWRFNDFRLYSGTVFPGSMMGGCTSEPAKLPGMKYVRVPGQIALSPEVQLYIGLGDCLEQCTALGCAGVEWISPSRSDPATCKVYSDAELNTYAVSSYASTRSLYLPANPAHAFRFEGTPQDSIGTLRFDNLQFSHKGRSGGMAAHLTSGVSATTEGSEGRLPSGSAPWTVSMWVYKISTPSGNGRALWSIGENSTNVALISQPDDTLRVSWGSETWYPNVTLLAGWHMLQVGYDGRMLHAQAGCQHFDSIEADVTTSGGALKLGRRVKRIYSGEWLVDDLVVYKHFTRDCGELNVLENPTAPYTVTLVGEPTFVKNEKYTTRKPDFPLRGATPFSLDFSVLWYSSTFSRCHFSFGSSGTDSVLSLCTINTVFTVYLSGTSYPIAKVASDDLWHTYNIRHDGTVLQIAIDGVRQEDFPVSLDITLGDVAFGSRLIVSGSTNNWGNWQYKDAVLTTAYTPLPAATEVKHAFTTTAEHKLFGRWPFDHNTRDAVGASHFNTNENKYGPPMQGISSMLIQEDTTSTAISQTSDLIELPYSFTLGFWLMVVGGSGTSTSTILAVDTNRFLIRITTSYTLEMYEAPWARTRSIAIDLSDTKWHLVRLQVTTSSVVAQVDWDTTTVSLPLKYALGGGTMKVGDAGGFRYLLDDMRMYTSAAPQDLWYEGAALSVSSVPGFASEWSYCSDEMGECMCDTAVRYGNGNRFMYGPLPAHRQYTECTPAAVSALSSGASGGATFSRVAYRCPVTSNVIVNGSMPYPTISECEGVCASDGRCTLCASYCGADYVKHYYMLTECTTRTPEYVRGGSACGGGISEKSYVNDPASGYTKTCQCKQPKWTWCAKENEQCVCRNGRMRFGYRDSWTNAVREGSGLCSAEMFPQTVGTEQTRSCYCSGDVKFSRVWRGTAGFQCTAGSNVYRRLSLDKCKKKCTPQTCKGFSIDSVGDCYVHSSGESCYPSRASQNITYYTWSAAGSSGHDLWGVVGRCSDEPLAETTSYDLYDCQGVCDSTSTCSYVTYNVRSLTCTLFETCGITDANDLYSHGRVFKRPRIDATLASWESTDCIRGDCSSVLSTGALHTGEGFTLGLQVLRVTGQGDLTVDVGDVTLLLSADYTTLGPNKTSTTVAPLGEWQLWRLVYAANELLLFSDDTLVFAMQQESVLTLSALSIIHSAAYRWRDAKLLRGWGARHHWSTIVNRWDFETDPSSSHVITKDIVAYVGSPREGTFAATFNEDGEIELALGDVKLSGKDPMTLGLWVYWSGGSSTITVISLTCESGDLSMGVSSEGKVIVAGTTSTAYSIAQSAWELLVITSDGNGVVRGYLNGMQVEKVSVTMSGRCSRLRLAADNTAHGIWLVDDVRYYYGLLGAQSWNPSGGDLLARFPLAEDVYEKSNKGFFSTAIPVGTTMYYNNEGATRKAVRSNTLHTAASTSTPFLTSDALSLTVGAWARCIADCDNPGAAIVGFTSSSGKLALAAGVTLSGSMPVPSLVVSRLNFRANATHDLYTSTRLGVDPTSWLLYRLVLTDGLLKVYVGGKLGVQLPINVTNVLPVNATVGWGDVAEATYAIHDVRVYSGVAEDIAWLAPYGTSPVTVSMGTDYTAGTLDIIDIHPEGCSNATLEAPHAGTTHVLHVVCSGRPASVRTSTRYLDDDLHIAGLGTDTIMESVSFNNKDEKSGWLSGDRRSAVWRDPEAQTCNGYMHYNKVWEDVLTLSDMGFTSYDAPAALTERLDVSALPNTTQTGMMVETDSTVVLSDSVSLKVTNPTTDAGYAPVYNLWRPVHEEQYHPRFVSYWTRVLSLPEISRNSSGLLFSGGNCSGSFIVLMKTLATGQSSLTATGTSCSNFVQASYGVVRANYWHKIEIHWPPTGHRSKGYGDAAVALIYVDDRLAIKLPLHSSTYLAGVDIVGYVSGPVTYFDNFKMCSSECFPLRAENLDRLLPCNKRATSWRVSCGGRTLWLSGDISLTSGEGLRCSLTDSFESASHGSSCVRQDGNGNTVLGDEYAERGALIGARLMQCFSSIDAYSQSRGPSTVISASLTCHDGIHCSGRGRAEKVRIGTCKCICSQGWVGPICDKRTSPTYPLGPPSGLASRVTFDAPRRIVEVPDKQPRMCSMMLPRYACGGTVVTTWDGAQDVLTSTDVTQCLASCRNFTSCSGVQVTRATGVCSFQSGMLTPVEHDYHDCYRMDTVEGCGSRAITVDNKDVCKAACRGCNAWWYNPSTKECRVVLHDHGWGESPGVSGYRVHPVLSDAVTGEALETPTVPRAVFPLGTSCPSQGCMKYGSIQISVSLNEEFTMSLWAWVDALTDKPYLQLSTGAAYGRRCEWEESYGTALTSGFGLGWSQSMLGCKMKCSQTQDCSAVSYSGYYCTGGAANTPLTATNATITSVMTGNCTWVTSHRSCTWELLLHTRVVTDNTSYIWLGDVTDDEECWQRCEQHALCTAFTYDALLPTCYGTSSLAPDVLSSFNSTTSVAQGCKRHVTAADYSHSTEGILVYPEGIEMRSRGHAESFSLPPLTPKQWTHVVLQARGRLWKIMYNGEQAREFEAWQHPAAYLSMAGKVVVGGSEAAVDDFWLWHSTLPDTLIKSAMLRRELLPREEPDEWYVASEIPATGLLPEVQKGTVCSALDSVTDIIDPWAAIQWWSKDDVAVLLETTVGAYVLQKDPWKLLPPTGDADCLQDITTGDTTVHIRLVNASGLVSLFVNEVQVCQGTMFPGGPLVLAIMDRSKVSSLQICRVVHSEARPTVSLTSLLTIGEQYSICPLLQDMVTKDAVFKLTCKTGNTAAERYFTGITLRDMEPGSLFTDSVRCSTTERFLPHNTLEGSECNVMNWKLSHHSGGLFLEQCFGFNETTDPTLHVAHRSTGSISFKMMCILSVHCGIGATSVAWAGEGCLCVCANGFEGERCDRCAFGYAGFPNCDTVVTGVAGQSVYHLVRLASSNDVELTGRLTGIRGVALSHNCMSQRTWDSLQHTSSTTAKVTFTQTINEAEFKICALRSDNITITVATAISIVCVNGYPSNERCVCYSDVVRGHWAGSACNYCKAGYRGIQQLKRKGNENHRKYVPAEI